MWLQRQRHTLKRVFRNTLYTSSTNNGLRLTVYSNRSFTTEPVDMKKENKIMGYATSYKTTEPMKASGMPTVEMPRTGWSISRCGFAAYESHISNAEKIQALYRAVTRDGVNTIEIDIDELFARRESNSSIYEPDESSRCWEKKALQRIFESQKVTRDQLVIIGKVGLRHTNQVTSSYDVEMLQSKIRTALEWINLQQFDLINACIPADPKQYGPSQIRSLLIVLEKLVDMGTCQAYGIGCSSFSALDDVSILPSPAQPVRTLFQTAESISSSHRLVALRHNTTLFQPQSLLPSVVDGDGHEWSLSELVSSYGISQFLSSPLDAYDSSNRWWRCMNTDAHTELTGKEVAQQLDEAINIAIHLELKFESEVWQAAYDEQSKRDADPQGHPLSTRPANWRTRRVEALPAQDFSWARAIGCNLGELDSLMQWRSMYRRRIFPAINTVVGMMASTDIAYDWARAYRTSMEHVKRTIDIYMERKHQHRAAQLLGCIHSNAPDLKNMQDLQDVTLGLLLSSPMSCAFVPDAFSASRFYQNTQLRNLLNTPVTKQQFQRNQNALMSIAEQGNSIVWPALKPTTRPSSNKDKIHPVATMIHEQEIEQTHPMLSGDRESTSEVSQKSTRTRQSSHKDRLQRLSRFRQQNNPNPSSS